jgi:hypothetical protein
MDLDVYWRCREQPKERRSHPPTGSPRVTILDGSTTRHCYESGSFEAHANRADHCLASSATWTESIPASLALRSRR